MIIAAVMAREAYFFWVCLIGSIVSIFPIFRLAFDDSHNLAVYGNRAADDSQDSKDGNKYTPCSQPFIQIQPNKKTKNNTPGHGKADLHDDA